MFCTKCGAELPEQANFCWKCGLPQRDDVEATDSRYEVCEIKYYDVVVGFGRASRKVFVAESVGPKGTLKVARSAEFLAPSTRQDYKKRWSELNALIAKLIDDGWEYVGSYGDGESWQRRFRRKIGE